jgi:hypothetical protein
MPDGNGLGDNIVVESFLGLNIRIITSKKI